MGLSMWLSRKTHVQNLERMKPEDRISIKLSGNTKGIDTDKISYIIEEVGFWRKANAIHGWIVDKCAGGKDQCQEIYLSKSKIGELHQLCCSILGEKSEEALIKAALKKMPPKEGFYFGFNEVGDWYKQDLKDTIKILGEVLAETDFTQSEIIYQASW